MCYDILIHIYEITFMNSSLLAKNHALHAVISRFIFMKYEIMYLHEMPHKYALPLSCSKAKFERDMIYEIRNPSRNLDKPRQIYDI